MKDQRMEIKRMPRILKPIMKKSSQIILREENANKKQKINHDTSVNLTNRDNNPKNKKSLSSWVMQSASNVDQS